MFLTKQSFPFIRFLMS